MISVIIPLYNKERAIRNTVESVLKQTFKEFELIIIDDGSTDNSADIVKEIAVNDNRIHYYYKPNGGVSTARNFGLSKAKGEWIIFLDADDEMLPINLEHLYTLANRHNVQIVAGNVMIKRNNYLEKSQLILDKPDGKVYKNIIPSIIGGEAIFPNGAVLINHNIFNLEKRKPYNETLFRYEDAEFELNLFRKYPIAVSSKPIHIIHSEFAELSKLNEKKCDKDFIFNLDFKEKTFWQKIYLGRFIMEGCSSYNNGFYKMKKKYGLNYYWRYLYLLVRKYYSIKHSFLRLIQ
ncbi:MAG: glycosyltransferase family 2 protein [Phocaeicola sp.]|nr:glycosyltransferase family 2 protein [Phocaeicola sp.]